MNFAPGFTTKAIAVDGATVSVTVGGAGPVIVLLHAYADKRLNAIPLRTPLLGNRQSRLRRPAR